MIRTAIVHLTTIPAIAYRQKLSSGGSGITVLRYNVQQPGLASISKTTGKAIPTENTSSELYPQEGFEEAIRLTAGMPYRRLGKAEVSEEIILEPEAETQEENAPEMEDLQIVVDSAEYQRVVDIYTDKAGRLSYELLNKDLIQTAKASGQVRLMIEDRASAEDILLQIVKAKLLSVSRNPALTDAQVKLMIELLDEVSPKGVLRPLKSEIWKWLREGRSLSR